MTNTDLKILHLNTYDIRGGAARAATRIHRALLSVGVDSRMLVMHKDGDDLRVSRVPPRYPRLRKRITRYLQRRHRTANPTPHSFNLVPSGLVGQINGSDADIVHLHWIGGDFISIGEVARIRKPLVWTLHDMWAFCGAEHYEDMTHPGRYRTGYTRADRPPGHAGIVDLDAWTWRRKRRHWRRVPFTFVTPSRWLADCLRESRLFLDAEAAVIPYSLDIDVFAPMDRKAARAAFGLPAEARILLFGADHGNRNPLKGYQLLEEALAILAGRTLLDRLELAVFGDPGKGKERRLLAGFPVTDIGRIDGDDQRLAMLYRAADMFVIPSIMDNLPNTVLEAMSCGIPCAGFRTGGIPDMIEHRENGYLAEPFDAGDLADGIKWVLDNSDSEHFGRKARLKVEQTYSNELIGRKYRQLYESVVNPG